MAIRTGHSYKLRDAQAGKEATYNTAVAATIILGALSDASLETDAPLEIVDAIGTLSPAIEVDILSVNGKIALEGTLTYEDAPFLFQAARGASAPGAGPPYLRTWLAPHQTPYDPESYTFEFGIRGHTQLYKVSGCVMTKLEITGKTKDFIRYKAEFGAATMATMAAFTALSVRNLTKMRFADLALYVDAFAGTPGTTAIASTLYEFKLNVETGHHMKTFNGSITPTAFGIDQWKGDLELTAEVNTTTDAYMANLIVGTTTQKIIDLKCTRGTQINELIFAGALDGSGQKMYDDENGNAVYKLKWQALYESTLTTWLKINNTNTVAVLPF